MNSAPVGNSERVAIVAVKRGLFILRYVSSDSTIAPCVFVRASPSSLKSFWIISDPDALEKSALAKPGDCVVVLAQDEGSLQLTVSPAQGGGLDANVRLEPLASAAPHAAEPLASLSASQTLPVESSVFSLMGHVAMRGDTPVGAGEWIGGPSLPAPIEGIQINWAPPDGVALEYQVLVAGAQGRWSDWMCSGGFAGNRGRRAPLVGVRLRLTGGNSYGLALKGEALFLGSPVVSEIGGQIEFASNSGAEPLVGLRLELCERSASAESPSDEPISTVGRVRVFRSGRAWGAEESAR